MRITNAEADYLGLDEEQPRQVRDDSPEAAEILALRASSGQRLADPPLYQPLMTPVTPAKGLPAHLRGMRTAWGRDDTRIENTRQEGE